MPISIVNALVSRVAAFRTTRDSEDPRATAFPLVRVELRGLEPLTL